MRFRISSCVAQIIRQAAADAHPREACGLLFGEEGVITSVQVTKNTAENPERHFEVDPAALFSALRAERSGAPKLLGYWHSHPSGDVKPSQTDVEMAALDGKYWLIVADGGMALWQLTEGAIYAHEYDAGAPPIGPLRGTAMSRHFRRLPLETDRVRDLLPRGKCDDELVPLLAEAGYPAVAPYLDELLRWTRDGNWPIAVPMADFLLTLGAPMVEPIRRVLRSDDKHGCLALIVRNFPPELRDRLVYDLRELAGGSGEDIEEGIDELAREILVDWGYPVASTAA